MPRNNAWSLRFALAAGVDARSFDGTPLAGEPLFKRAVDGDPVSMPEWDDGEGIYSDIVAFLNGFSTHNGLDFADLSFNIDENDRVTITNSGEHTYTLIGGANNAWWGLPTGANIVIAPGATYTAPDEWRRGLVTNGAGANPPALQFVETAVGLVQTPATYGLIQDIRVSLRARGDVGDVDDTGATTLEALDNAVYDPDDSSCRWFVTDEGRVGWTSTATEDAIIWLSSAFRDMLGFSGNEAVTRFAPPPGGGFESGICYGQIADKPCPLIFIPMRPMIRQVHGADQIGDALRLADGRFSSAHTGTYPKQRIEFWVEGPQDVGGVDYHRHWIRFRSLTPRGWPVTLYQDWGDSRRALGIESLTDAQDAYDLTYTSQRNGLYGRVVGYVHPDTEDPLVDYDGFFRIKARASFVIATGERFNG